MNQIPTRKLQTIHEIAIAVREFSQFLFIYLFIVVCYVVP